MPAESNRFLQRVSYALLLVVVGAVAYFVARDYFRGREAADDLAPLAASNVVRIAGSSAPPPVSASSAPVKESYAPLRPRVNTNPPAVPVRPPARALAGGGDVAGGGQRPGAEPPVAVVAGGARVEAAVGGSVGGPPGSGPSVTGRVLLRGTPPPEKSVVLDAACGRLNPAPVTTRHYVVGEGGGLADVFVYVLRGAPLQRAAPGLAPALLDQVNCQYQPYVLGVQAGQVLKVRNSDPILHNVHMLTKVPGGRARNVGQPVKGMTHDFVFEKPEVFVQFKCDVHPWMFAYVGVMDHPWFAITDKKGQFTLPPGLPAGQYTLAALHRKLGEQTQIITVGAGAPEPVVFTLEVPAP